jgi:hypothetical protein
LFLIVTCQFFLRIVIFPLNAEDTAPAKEKTSEAQHKQISAVEEEVAGVLGWYALMQNAIKKEERVLV